MAGGISGKMIADLDAGYAAADLGDDGLLVEPLLLPLGEGREDEVHHGAVGERRAVVEQREAADAHPAGEPGRALERRLDLA